MDGNRENTSSLPAPTSDIKIRTMNSDIQNMGLGGGIPQMTVAQAPAVDLNPVAQAPVFTTPQATSVGSRKFLYIVVSILGIAVLFALGFFLPKVLFKTEPAPTQTQNAKPTQTSNSGTATTTPTQKPAETQGLVHASFFKSGSVGVPVNIPIASNLTTENIAGLITQQTSVSSASFLEMTFNKENKAVSWKEFINVNGWKFLPENFFTDNFKDDFTTYMHKDSFGSHPGYILELRPDATIVLLRSQLLKIESAPLEVAKIFLSSPSGPATTFTDTQINGQPMRTLKFSSSESFYYGWYNNKYLILGTSEEGVKTATSKL